MNKPEIIIISQNGSIGAFDNKDEQIGELQIGMYILYFEFLESKGFDPREIKSIETMINGRWVYIKPFKTDANKWNYEITPKI